MAEQGSSDSSQVLHKRKPRLETLPTEVLLSIFQRPSDITSLCRCSRECHRVFQKLLYILEIDYHNTIYEVHTTGPIRAPPLFISPRLSSLVPGYLPVQRAFSNVSTLAAQYRELHCRERLRQYR